MKRKILTVLLIPFIVIGAGVLINSAGSDSTGNNLQHQVGQPLNPHPIFKTAGNCMSCHNQLATPAGEDVSIGTDWRASMMANSSRDPYWQAAVRREVTDHPHAQAKIENECSTCHMPMAHFEASIAGQQSRVFANLSVNKAVTRRNILAADGVSCTMCHQITDHNFGKRESFTGHFTVDSTAPMGQRDVFGPYKVDAGRTRIMHSSSGFRQKQSAHIQKSELCASCHTLITESLGPDGEVIGELPEQVPYLEWRHSSFKDEQSCQSCHMPVVKEPTPIASVNGQPRKGFSRHSFRGGNFFMLSMLNRYRADLGVQALPQEMDEAVTRTRRFLETQSARLLVGPAKLNGDTLVAEVEVSNLAGHKLPTAYPSRRTWIHFTVTDAEGKVIFESGDIKSDGAIAGNDNDEDANRYEPHHRVIDQPQKVQIYEAIMAGPQDEVTTGLLTAVRFIKDNRLLPRGFDKATAGDDIAVQGGAYKDRDFKAGGDQVTYRVATEGAREPLRIQAELIYQPIAYRWAQNLGDYDTGETNRFVNYYDAMSNNSSQVLASDMAQVE